MAWLCNQTVIAALCLIFEFGPSNVVKAGASPIVFSMNGGLPSRTHNIFIVNGDSQSKIFTFNSPSLFPWPESPEHRINIAIRTNVVSGFNFYGKPWAAKYDGWPRNVVGFLGPHQEDYFRDPRQAAARVLDYKYHAGGRQFFCGFHQNEPPNGNQGAVGGNEFFPRQIDAVAGQSALPDCGPPQRGGEESDNSAGIVVHVIEEPRQQAFADYIFTGIMLTFGTYLWVKWCRREREYEESKKNWRK